MKQVHDQRRAGRAGPSEARQGFTLIELLVVIGIIVILISLLLPAIQAVRRKGYETTTRAQLTRIGSAINAYYNDFKSYPGPIDETTLNAVTQPKIGAAALTGITKVTSSENLVLGLLGGLAFDGTNFTFAPNNVNLSVGSLNPFAASRRQYNCYLDVTPEELSPRSGATFEALGTSDSVIPEFLDHIPSQIIGSTNADFQSGPIIYMRCTVSAGQYAILAEGATQTSPKSAYFFKQAAPYGFTTVLATDFVAQAASGSVPAYTSNAVYFENPNVLGVPKGKDSFILISAGSDRIYGTRDDIIYSY